MPQSFRHPDQLLEKLIDSRKIGLVQQHMIFTEQLICVGKIDVPENRHQVVVQFEIHRLTDK